MNHLKTAAMLTLLAFAACGDGGGSNLIEPPPPPHANTGTLAVTVRGLPSGQNGAVAVTGPGGFSRTLTASQTLTGLAAGVYTANINPVTVNGLEYGAAQTLRFVEVPAGGSLTLDVEYRGFNLQVDNFYITQSIQRFDGSVPLVAGRDGYLRVFATANNQNAAAPKVRVQLFHGGAPVHTRTIDAPSFAVPTEVNEATLTSSWNVLLDGALIRPGMSVLVEIDPDGQVAEADENDNVFPRSRAPRSLTVHTLPTLEMVLVPLRQPNGTLGNVTEANKDQYVVDLLRMFPIGASRVTVREPYNASVNLRPEEGWVNVVTELEAVRASEARPGVYYYGVGTINYTSGIYGIAFRPGWTGVGNDYLDNRNLNASMTLAHEVGHNMGRPHSQCGSVSGLDPEFPHPNGQIGAFGLDLRSLRQYLPAARDLMGYCEDRWIADFTYERVLQHRLTREPRPAAEAPVEESLIVWGRVDAAGSITLEPAFRAETTPQLPAGAGPFLLEGIDASGARLFAMPFAARAVEHAAGERIFVFAVPARLASADRLATLRVSGGGRSASVGATAESGRAAPGWRTEAVRGGRTRLRWDVETHPLAVVRNPRTGRIVSLARGGVVELPAAETFDVELSDGVGRARHRVVPR